MSKPVTTMDSVVSLDYERPPTLVARQHAQAVREKRLLAHQCPKCERIYTPPRGYCPICTVPTGEENELQLSDRGVVLTFTITRADPKVAKEQTEPICRGTIILDGAPVRMMGEIRGLAPEEVRTGMRVRAIWSDDFYEGGVGARRGGWGPAGIRGWEPSGEPDMPVDDVRKMASEAAQQ